MSSSTHPSRTEIAEGFGALFVIAVGLLGIPLLLATIVGWPLPHHLPTTGQLHSAAGSQIPDTFWPKALAVIAWLAWGYFVFSLLTATIDVIRSRRRGTWRRAAGRTSMAALVSAVIVLASLRGSAAAHRITPMPAVTAVVDAFPAPSIVLSGSHAQSSPTRSSPETVCGTSLKPTTEWRTVALHLCGQRRRRTARRAGIGCHQLDLPRLEARHSQWSDTDTGIDTGTGADSGAGRYFGSRYPGCHSPYRRPRGQSVEHCGDLLRQRGAMARHLRRQRRSCPTR